MDKHWRERLPDARSSAVDRARAPQAGSPPRPVLLGQHWPREWWGLMPCRAPGWVFNLQGTLPCGSPFSCPFLELALGPVATLRLSTLWAAGSLPTEAVSACGAGAGLWAWTPGTDVGPALPGPRSLATFSSFRTPCWLRGRHRIQAPRAEFRKEGQEAGSWSPRWGPAAPPPSRRHLVTRSTQLCAWRRV